MAMATDMAMNQRMSRLDAVETLFAIFRESQRSRAEILMRLFAVFVCVLLAYWAAANAVVNVTKRKNPDIALSFDSGDPVALTLTADLQFLAAQDGPSLEKVDYTARKALGVQPLNATALRILAYLADVQGDGLRARDLVVASTKLSRRDFGSQLWLIESAVRQNRTKAVLAHYDIAMRTSYDTRTVLFPTLVGALGRQDVRNALVPYMRAPPQWLPGFLHQAIGEADNPEDVAHLILLSGGFPSESSSSGLSDYLLSELAGKGKFRMYKQYYTSLPGAKVAALKSTAFDTDTVGAPYPTAGWQLFEGAGVGSSFVASVDSGQSTLTVFAGSGERNIVTRKLLFLAPGRYRINVSHSSDSSSSNAEAIWDVQCVTGGGTKSLWSKTVPISRGRFSATGIFSVGSACGAEMLSLNVAGGSDQLGTEFSVEKVALTAS